MYMTHQNKTAAMNKNTFWKDMLASSWISLFHPGRPGSRQKTASHPTPQVPYTGFRVPQGAQSYDMLVASDVVTGISTVVP